MEKVDNVQEQESNLSIKIPNIKSHKEMLETIQKKSHFNKMGFRPLLS